MARTITEIQAEIVAAVQGDATLSGASSTSSTAIWRLITRVIASAVWALEVLYDAFRAELIAEVEALRPHTLRWYQEKALLFQYGSDLPEDSDVYDNSLLTDDQVAAQKIIAQAAATAENGTVNIKVAREVSGALAQLLTAQYNALVAYFDEVKDAGVTLEVLNAQGDKLTVTAAIYYDPLVLNSSGNRIDGTENEPVQNAIKAYLRALPFNGLLVRSTLVDVMQAVSGVYVPDLTSLQAGRFDATSLAEVSIQYLPYSGYFRLADLTLNLTFISKNSL